MNDKKASIQQDFSCMNSRCPQVDISIVRPNINLRGPALAPGPPRKIQTMYENQQNTQIISNPESPRASQGGKVQALRKVKQEQKQEAQVSKAVGKKIIPIAPKKGGKVAPARARQIQANSEEEESKDTVSKNNEKGKRGRKVVELNKYFNESETKI